MILQLKYLQSFLLENTVVPVIMQLEFQQSKVFVFQLPQIQFIDRLWTFQLRAERGTHSANCAENPWFHSALWSTFLWAAATSSCSTPVSCANCTENRRDSTGAVLGCRQRQLKFLKSVHRQCSQMLLSRDSDGFSQF